MGRGVRNILVISRDRSFVSSGAAQFFKEAIESVSQVHRFTDFSENPKIEEIERGVSAIDRLKPDMIVAVGGGSAIDTAKLINYFAAHGVMPEQYLNGDAGVDRKCLPLVAIPTTVGSGSEATKFAVMYVDRKKISVESIDLRPCAVILDPNLTLSLPALVIASSGMDALSQAIESFWSVHSTNESRLMAESAMKATFSCLEGGVRKHELSLMENLMNAAYLSGCAINITKTTAPHAISYTLTSHFGVKHGQAVGLFLPWFLEHNNNVSDGDCLDKRGVAHVKDAIGAICSILGFEDVVSAKNGILELMYRVGLKTKLSQLGVCEDSDVALIADNVNKDRLSNNPRTVTGEQLKTILDKMM